MAATNLVADGKARRGRLLLDRGAQTTVYVACHDSDRTEISVVLPGERLAPWCGRHAVSEAIVGGFFTRPDGVPLGAVRTHGVARDHVPVEAPWHTVRACLHVEGGEARIARRDRIACVPRGDLLQAGPLLVADGEVAYDPDRDDEGFCAAAHQFDPDPTLGRHPRAAIGLADGRVFAVACDGRSAREAGLTLTELARFMAALGCRQALNLDGGGSTALISGGRLQNSRGATSRCPSRAAVLWPPRLRSTGSDCPPKRSSGAASAPFTARLRGCVVAAACRRPARGMVTAWSQIVHSGGGP